MNGQVVNTRRRRRRPPAASKAAMRKDEARNARLLRQKFGSPMKETTAGSTTHPAVVRSERASARIT